MNSDAELENRASIMTSSDFFSHFSPDEIRLLAGYSVLKEYKAGEAIFLIDKPGESLFIVDEGEVIIRKRDESLRMIDIARFLKHNCFGEMDLFTRSKRNAEAWALSDSRLLVFPRPGCEFREILVDQPALAARILHKFMVLMAGRIRTANAMIKENSPIVQELKKQVYVDKLTGLYNKTFLEEKIKSLCQKPDPFALLMFKPDNFKALNDQYGHEAGDQALQMIGRKLLQRIGDPERIIRYMGNEHAVLLPGAGREEAKKLAFSLRRSLNRMSWEPITGDQPFRMTASFGIALYPEYTSDPLELILLAHELPLIGRGRGGNRILFPEDKE